MTDQDDLGKENDKSKSLENTPNKQGTSFRDLLCEELQVDKALLLYKGFYFLFFAGFGASFPYMALYFKQIGLNASSVGILAGIRPMIQFISGPFWAVLADRYKARKAVLLFSIFSWLVMTLALLIPKPYNTYCKNLMENSNENVSIFTGRHSRRGVDLQIDNVISVDIDHQRNPRKVKEKLPSLIGNAPFRTFFIDGSSRQLSEYEVSNSKKFKLIFDQKEIYRVYIYLLILVVGGEFLEAPTFIMADTGLLQKLGEKRRHYGKTRLFGSLGFAFASLIVGELLDMTEYKYCGRVMNNYNILFYSFAIIMALTFVFAAWMFEFTYEDVSDDSDGKSSTKEFTNATSKIPVCLLYNYFILSRIF